MCIYVCVEVRGQPSGAGSLLTSRGFQRWNSSRWACWKVPFPLNPPHLPFVRNSIVKGQGCTQSVECLLVAATSPLAQSLLLHKSQTRWSISAIAAPRQEHQKIKVIFRGFEASQEHPHTLSEKQNKQKGNAAALR